MRGITSSKGGRTPKEANNLYYELNKENKVKREKKKKKGDGRKKGSTDAERKQGATQRVTRCHS